MTDKTLLSAVVVTHNEEANIEDCLKSLDWVDDLIVVDGESTDATREIARSFTDNVLVKANAPCEEQRKFGVQKTKHPWLLLVDADERISEELREEIKGTITKADPESAYYLLRRNYLNGRATHMHHPDYQMRLFRREQLEELPRQIHKKPEIKGKTGRLKGELTHYFFPSVESFLAKIGFYTSIEAQYLLEKPGFSPNPLRSLYYFFIKPCLRFTQNFFLKKGFLDGRWGFFLALGSAYYDMAVYMQYLLLRKKGKCCE